MTVPPVVDLSQQFRSLSISPASLDDLAVPLLGILLSGLALVLAWLSAACGGFNTFWQQQQQQQQSSSRHHRDNRPIAVFVFENFSPASSSNNATAVPGEVEVFGEEESRPDDGNDITPRENHEDMELMNHDHGHSDNDDEEVENVDSGDLSESSDPPHGNNVSSLAAYDIDVLESDGELDAEMRDRVEEVLLEYTMVMEAKSDADLRNRRLKYFNCLLDTNGAQPVQSALAATSVSTASTQTSCSCSSSLLSVPTETIVQAEEAPNSPLTLRLRLKYFNDSQRTVVASPVETIASFKRKHFATELSQNQSVRLIHNGRELKEGQDRSLTLESYALPQDTTIHCLVVEAPEPPPQTSLTSSQAQSATASLTMSSAAAMEDFAHLQHGDIGGYMFPLFLAILALIWYCRVYYRAYFNFLSTMAMCAATLLLCAAIVAAFFSAGSSNAGDLPSGGWGQIRVHRINLDSQATTTDVQQRRSQQRRDASSMTG